MPAIVIAAFAKDFNSKEWIRVIFARLVPTCDPQKLDHASTATNE